MLDDDQFDDLMDLLEIVAQLPVEDAVPPGDFPNA